MLQLAPKHDKLLFLHVVVVFSDEFLIVFFFVRIDAFFFDFLGVIDFSSPGLAREDVDGVNFG
ncbi:hypothetical protein NEOLI_005315 [Neolecta irregularis DAH-3]|uniref:Transmembrane protein n=1 Tax=Neolecta irregularis (strain DAH-3) TaxID=1198029 RepID=A0A1U7LKZ9_NEOID|nr:hypothetical protein NEOLI_005315 [Neolecta irregularis DAH-3]|eukprot:OLL23335.1 hypothetical protein NEOLI_005315 [Neolecta irregularis DAH-3]